MEKTASKMFDAQMKLNGVMVKNKELTADYLSTIAQNDLPKAVELLSELYTKGQLSIRTLSKIFTSRHSPYLIAQLQLMNGNINQYVDSMTEGAKVQEDFEKGIQSFSNQLRLLKNNVNSMNYLFGEFADTVGVDVIGALNSILVDMRSFSESGTTTARVLGSMTNGLIAFGITLSAVSTVMIAFTKIKAMMVTSMGAGLPILIGITALVASLTAIYSYYKKINIEKERALEKDRLLVESTEKQIKANEDLLVLLNGQVTALKELSETDFTENWDKAYDIISAITDKSAQLQSILTATEKIKTFELPELESANDIYKDILKTLEDQIKESEKEILSNNSKFKKNTKQYKIELEHYKNIDKFRRKNIDTEEDYQKAVIDFAKKRPDTFLGSNTMGLISKSIDTRTKEGFSKAEKLFREFGKDQGIQMSADISGVSYDQAVQDKILSYEEYIKNEKAKILKEEYRDNVEYSSLVNRLKLNNLQVDEYIRDRMLKNAEKGSEQFDAVNQFYSKFKGENFMVALAKEDPNKLSYMYKSMPEYLKESLNELQYIEMVDRARFEHANKTNQEMEKLLSYFNQIAKVSNEIEYENFAKMASGLENKTPESYKKLATDMGFDEVGKGMGDLIAKGFTESDITKLIADGKLLDTVGFYKEMDKAIENLMNSKFSEKAMEAFIVENPKEWKKIANTYKDARSDLDKYVAYMTGELIKLEEQKKRALTFIDPRSIKTAFYQDNQIALELELQKIKLKGLDLLQKEAEINEYNYNIAMNRLQSEIDLYSKKIPLNKDLIGMDKKQLLDQKKQIETIRDLEISGKVDGEVTFNMKDRYASILKLLEFINQKQVLIGDNQKANLSITQNQEKIIDDTVSNIDKILEKYSKLINKNKTYAELTKLVGKNTRESVENEYKSINTKLKNYKNTVLELKSKKNLNESEKAIVKGYNEYAETQEDKLKNLKQLLEWMGKYESITDKITANEKKAKDIRENTMNLNKNAYDVAKARSATLNKNIKDKKKEISDENDELKLSEMKLELANLQYEKEVNTNTILAERNDLINQAMTGTGQIIDLLAGADSGLSQVFGVINDISGLVTSGAFDNISKGLSGIQAGNTMSGMAGILGGAGAVASVGSSVINSYLNKNDAKAESRFKKQHQVALDQLDVLNKMESGISGFGNELFESLKKLPTFSNSDKMISNINDIQKTARKNANISDMSITSRSGSYMNEGFLVGGALGGFLGSKKRKKKTYNASFMDVLFGDQGILTTDTTTGRSDLDALKMSGITSDMGLSDLTIKQMEKISILVKDISSNDLKNWEGLWGGGDLTSANFETIVDQFNKYLSLVKSLDRLDMENLMKEATFADFESVDFTTYDEAIDKSRTLGESLKLTGDDLQFFVEQKAKDFEGLSSDAGITIRDAIVSGVGEGLSETEILVNGFKSVFDEMSRDINSAISDIYFGEMYQSIDDITVQMGDELGSLKTKTQEFVKTTKEFHGSDFLPDGTSIDEYGAELFKGESLDVQNKYIDKMINQLDKAQDIDSAMTDFNTSMREAMVNSGKFSEEFINDFYPIEEEVNALQDEFDDLKDSVTGFYKEALMADDLESGMALLGSNVADTFINSFIDEALSNKYAGKMGVITASLYEQMNEGFNISAIQSIQSGANKAFLEMQNLQNQALVVKDLLNINMADVEYEVDRNIQYETGSTTSVINNYNYTAQIGNLIADDPSLHAFALKFKEVLENV